ncbi:FAD binding domain-containing protein [Lichenicoccus roseus]|uniref:Xanthine dehydrogenase family protein subunit M n=1 Tax=Lichenicoccus roseus TaxID=2683649 RepID=A0A5R9JCV9_9PROT|nr:xanthine dehydrogenase family protein subunit M [Lichenicoccus roseus]TLU73451.1 xanthine dehydrogenase family protein subunit M [Lichenicoccus roseus]
MRAFSYERPTQVAQAAHAATTHPDASYIGGGTNLLDLMKLDVAQPAHLVDVNRLPMERIELLNDGSLRIGALVRNSTLAADPHVRRHHAVLSRALLSGATAQLRNKATTAGNLLQRTRCYYFTDVSKACNKRVPGSGCEAIGGYNRIHAILGASASCIATHPSDMAVAMLALDAVVETDRRHIPIAELHRLPGDTPQIDNTLQPGELIVAVRLPPPVPSVQLYRKVRDRASYAFAAVSVAALIQARHGRIELARLAFGGVAHRPWRNHAAEQLLVGHAPSHALFERVADSVVTGAAGQGSNDYKIPLLRRTLVATLRQATEG